MDIRSFLGPSAGPRLESIDLRPISFRWSKSHVIKGTRVRLSSGDLEAIWFRDNRLNVSSLY